jgi:hypothetical protein
MHSHHRMLSQPNMFRPLRPSSGIPYARTRTHTLSNSSADIVTRLLTGQSRFNSWEKQEIFLFTKASRRVLGPTPPPMQELLRTANSPMVSKNCVQATKLRYNLVFDRYVYFNGNVFTKHTRYTIQFLHV